MCAQTSDAVCSQLVLYDRKLQMDARPMTATYVAADSVAPMSEDVRDRMLIAVLWLF